MVDNLMNESLVEDTKNNPLLNKKRVKRKLFILITIVALIVAGLVATAVKLYTTKIAVETCSEGEVYNRTTGEPCVGVIDETATPQTGSPTYLTALKTYEGRNILFDANCVATPDLLTAPTSSKVMIANNSQKTLELSIQGKKANLLPYYYMVSSIKNSGEFPVSCNGIVSATVQANCRIVVKSGESFPCPIKS